jgi:hypothetical protein
VLAATVAQPIAGVSPSQDRVVEVVYQTIAAAAPGRLIGSIMDCIPVRVGGVKLSNLIFGLPLAPFGLAGYLMLKVFGRKFILTSRSINIATPLTARVLKQVPLKDVAEVEIDVRSGQEFHHAGDLVLLSAKGDLLARLEGVSRPDRFRRLIVDTRDARIWSEESLAVISKRA